MEWTDGRTKRQRHLARLAALKNEQSSWREHWRDISEQIQPRKARLLSNDRNNGSKRNQKIINNTPTRAARTLTSGMMAGITSPARPWFRLTTPDPSLAEYGSVKQWLFVVESRMRQAIAKSGVYNGLHQVYENLADIGTAAMHLDDDAEAVARAYVFPVGQYYLANSSRLRVDTVYRELSMTVSQCVEAFGFEKCSRRIRELYQRREFDVWMDIVHVIEPNATAEYGAKGPKGMRFVSCWLDAGADETEGYLRESGYHEFPVLCPRWAVTGEDVYGSSPGMDTLGDCKALQHLELRKAQLFDKTVSPPMVGPASLMNRRTSLLPGDTTYVDSPNPGMFQPAIVINPSAMKEAREAIAEHERRINAGFYADLWLMMAQGGNGEMTAREVAERHEEKMLQLGPVMERLQDELLDPLIDRFFGLMLRNGDVPPPPEELQGVELKVEYLSIMAQAQKMLGTSAVERLSSFVGSLATAFPDALDKLDADQTVDEYSNMLGTPPALVRTDEDVAKLRAARAKAQQEQALREQQAQLAEGAKTLSQADTSGDNGLTRLLGNLGGVAGLPPGGGAGVA